MASRAAGAPESAYLPRHGPEPVAHGNDDADTGRLLLALKPNVVPHDVPTLQAQAQAAGLTSLLQALATLGNPPTGRAIFGLSLERILFIERQSEWPVGIRRHSLADFWWIDVAGIAPPLVVQFLERAPELAGVLTAYREPVFMPPSDPLVGVQHHLQASTGIDAVGAWALSGANGANVRVALIDRWWDLTHADLNGLAQDHVWPPGPLNPPATAFEVEHGMLSIGLVAARENGQQGQGVAFGVTRVATASYRNYQVSGVGQVNNLPTAIMHCVSALFPPGAVLRRGDILLLEAMLLGVPAELDFFTRVAVTIAVGCGIVVVAAAGNVAADIALAEDPAFPWLVIHPFEPGGLHEWDSGSVIVGAASVVPNIGPVQVSGTAFGQRVNCCAPGQNVLVFNGLTFDNTSAATAIIAGAAAGIQSRQLELHPLVPLSPAAIRGLLATITILPATSEIGVMPHLAGILAAL